MTAASELSRLGSHVDVIEYAGLAGGNVLSYCCKATDSCSRCGVCVAHTELAESLRSSNVSLHTDATVKTVTNTGEKITVQISVKQPAINYNVCVSCDACVHACPQACISKYSRGGLVQYEIDHSKCLLHLGEVCTACVDACAVHAIRADAPEKSRTLTGRSALVATGHRPFDAVQKPRFGYGRLPNVITGFEAEKALTDEMVFSESDSSVAFIQCVGSRDPVIGRNFCSGVCCAYAMRLARIVKYRRPDTEVTIYYIDLQNFDKNFSALKREIEDLGVKFVRGIPFKIDESVTGSLRVMLEEVNGETSVVEHDRVVLSVGMDKSICADATASRFGLSIDEFGFISSTDENVFVGGTGREPMSIVESMACAKAIASKMSNGGVKQHG